MNKENTQKRKKKAKVVRKVVDNSSSDCDAAVVTNDNDSDDVDLDHGMLEDKIDSDFLTIKAKDYVLVKCRGEKSAQHFVANVRSDAQEFEVIHSKKMQKTDNFLRIEGSDIFSVHEDDIVLKLPPPVPVGGTARNKNFLRFRVSFENYNMG
ncbi:hypothetical protein JTB14_018960 [Gonioctena quinquepunctata]|nr:hypothetical protein JTB14_018960 [Gonioctena quinquepunctata]